MTKRLSEGDRRAVDLMLDRAAVGTANSNGNSSADGNGQAMGDGNGGSSASAYVSHAHGADDQRVSAVSRVLHLLDNLPAPEPAADLMERTLRRVASATGQPMPAMMQPTAGGFAVRPPPQQPHA
jgi:hypothetical protein